MPVWISVHPAANDSIPSRTSSEKIAEMPIAGTKAAVATVFTTLHAFRKTLLKLKDFALKKT